MNILGTGIVFTRGQGMDSFERALQEGWRSPGIVPSPPSIHEERRAYLVEHRTLSDRELMKKVRRADKLSKMAVIAASEALRNSTGEDINRKKTGIIAATALGAHVTTFDFLDNILEYGEASVSPTTFSNSVHNAAASYISSVLGTEGPTLTVTDFFFSFHNALQLAQSWLLEKRCDYILAGVTEQYGSVQAYVHDTKLTAAPDGRIRPFNFNPTFQVPGEGSVFFLLSHKEADKALCEVHDVLVNTDGCDVLRGDLDVIDTDGLLADESHYLQTLSGEVPVASYTPLFGSIMSGSAFTCAAGVRMLEKQMIYASPVKENPHGLNIAAETRPGVIELLRCIRYNCYGNKAVIYLRKK